MFDFYTQIGSFTLQSFTVLLGIGVLFSGLVGLALARGRYARCADAYLCAVALAVIGSRAVHVLLSPVHFAYNPSEMLQIASGGLNWHGAVIGGLVGLALGAWWRKIPFRQLLDTLTLSLPLVCFFAWAGCSVAACGYGQEVETLAYYSPLVVHEAPTVYGGAAPRYNTQFLGMALAVIAAGFAGMLCFRNKGQGWRFWGVLALVSVGMFSIGFIRADAGGTLAGLRQDQWLDLLLFVGSCAALIWALRHPLTPKLSESI